MTIRSVLDNAVDRGAHITDRAWIGTCLALLVAARVLWETAKRLTS